MGETERDTGLVGKEQCWDSAGGLIKVGHRGLGLGTGPRRQDNKTHPLLDHRGSGGVLWLPRWNGGWGLTLVLFVEKSSSAGGGWSCPGPPWSSCDQALPVLSLVSLVVTGQTGCQTRWVEVTGMEVSDQTPKTSRVIFQGKQSKTRGLQRFFLAEKDGDLGFDVCTYEPRFAWSSRLSTAFPVVAPRGQRRTAVPRSR